MTMTLLNVILVKTNTMENVNDLKLFAKKIELEFFRHLTKVNTTQCQFNVLSDTEIYG